MRKIVELQLVFSILKDCIWRALWSSVKEGGNQKEVILEKSLAATSPTYLWVFHQDQDNAGELFEFAICEMGFFAIY